MTSGSRDSGRHPYPLAGSPALDRLVFGPPVSPLPAEGETERPTLASLIDAVDRMLRDLPEQGATAGRDYGRGLAHASRSVLNSPEWYALVRAALMSPASAAAGEVRVEWGVRYDAIGYQGRRRSPVDKFVSEAEARAELPRYVGLPGVHDPRVVSRTVTTSAWVPVTDDQEQT